MSEQEGVQEGEIQAGNRYTLDQENVRNEIEPSGSFQV